MLSLNMLDVTLLYSLLKMLSPIYYLGIMIRPILIVLTHEYQSTGDKSNAIKGNCD